MKELPETRKWKGYLGKEAEETHSDNAWEVSQGEGGKFYFCSLSRVSGFGPLSVARWSSMCLPCRGRGGI